jgi:hypothetical protein
MPRTVDTEEDELLLEAVERLDRREDPPPTRFDLLFVKRIL